LPKLAGFYVGLLQADKLFERSVHRLKVQSSTREAWFGRGRIEEKNVVSFVTDRLPES
jgi:hypothetical protein